jgi:hypothetical protein
MNHLKRHVPAAFVTGILFCFAAALPVSANLATEQEWRFRVYLDDKPIGYHNFTLAQAGAHEQLTTQAQFDVSFLKIPLFKYRHDNVERWNKSCLESITSTTDENGKLFQVNGTTTDKGFQLSTISGDITLPGCISTFAYWDESFLQHERLLNSQTGEYLDVDVENLGEQSIITGDTPVPATHYRLTGEGLAIELWYSRNGQWLALQSTTLKGRLLRYVIE